MNTYIQNKLDIIDIFDYIVFEDGDIDKEKSNKKLKQSLTEAYNKGQTDYHNHIVEMLNTVSIKPENAEDRELADALTVMFYHKILPEILSKLQDTNPKE